MATIEVSLLDPPKVGDTVHLHVYDDGIVQAFSQGGVDSAARHAGWGVVEQIHTTTAHGQTFACCATVRIVRRVHYANGVPIDVDCPNGHVSMDLADYRHPHHRHASA